MAEAANKMKKYQLVKFIGELKNEVNELAIDRIPCDWVRYDVESGRVVAKFPPPPYTAHSHKFLEKLIQTEGAPLSSWPEYPVDLVGHANTYKESIERLVVLETEPYAYTDDSEIEPGQKAAAIIEKLKRKSLEALLEVPPIGDGCSPETDSSFDREFESETSSEETVSLHRKIKNNKGKIKPRIRSVELVKPSRDKSGASKSHPSVSPGDDTDIDDAYSVPESEELDPQPEKDPVKSKKVQGKVKSETHLTKVTKSSCGKSDTSRSRSSLVASVDINYDANFVQESKKLGPIEKNSQSVKGKKVLFKTLNPTKQKNITKACIDNSGGPRRQSTSVNVDNAPKVHFVPESADHVSNHKPKQSPSRAARPQNNDGGHMEQLDLVEPRSASFGASRPQSTITNHIDEGAYFVGESGVLVLDPNQNSITGAQVQNEVGGEVDAGTEFVRDSSIKKRQTGSFFLKTTTFDESLQNATQTLRRAEGEYSKDTLLLLSTLKSLSVDLNQNTKAINNLCAVLHQDGNTHAGKARAPITELQFDLPFQTIEAFKEFDGRLKQDKKYRQDCAASLLLYVDPDNQVPKSMTNIIKKFVGRNVAMQFTAVKQVANKEVLKGMKFYDVMFVLTQHHRDNQGQPICEKYFNQCLGNSLTNAKDWDGFRVERAKREIARKKLSEQERNKE